MPKIKTSRSAAKRFRKTGSGKLRRRHAYASHNLSTKSPKRKRRLRQGAIASQADTKKLKRLIANL